MLSVSVDYITADGVFPHEVLGEPEEPFLDALIRVLGPAPWRGQYHFVFESEPGVSSYTAVIDGSVTVAQVDQFADGDVICIDSYGRGGGVIESLFGLVSAGLTIGSVVSGSTASYRKLGQLVRRADRRAAREWLYAGLDSEPSMQLKQAVRREAEWTPAAFERTFGLGMIAGPALLRQLGYQHVTDKWSDYWVDRTE
ncbi:hypothetical protein [Microbacterium plantarum]|uniref:Uncharacterized protein n=1 Tax=Microbacterium plantarum TaxID=1816425 RepID=A0ABV5EST0_9MICO